LARDAPALRRDGLLRPYLPATDSLLGPAPLLVSDEYASQRPTNPGHPNRRMFIRPSSSGQVSRKHPVRFRRVGGTAKRRSVQVASTPLDRTQRANLPFVACPKRTASKAHTQLERRRLAGQRSTKEQSQHLLCDHRAFPMQPLAAVPTPPQIPLGHGNVYIPQLRIHVLFAESPSKQTEAAATKHLPNISSFAIRKPQSG